MAEITSLRDLYSPDRAPTPKPKKQTVGAYLAHFTWGAVTGQSACGHEGPKFVCTRIEGHKGLHEAYKSDEYCYSLPWDDDGKYVAEKDIPKCTETKGEAVCAKFLTHEGEHEFFTIWKYWFSVVKAGAKYKMAPISVARCLKVAPEISYVCTREKGHDGPHEAHYSSGFSCGEPWDDGIKYKAIKKQ